MTLASSDGWMSPSDSGFDKASIFAAQTAASGFSGQSQGFQISLIKMSVSVAEVGEDQSPFPESRRIGPIPGKIPRDVKLCSGEIGGHHSCSCICADPGAPG